MLTYPKNFEGSITILGEKGTVRIGGVAVNEIEHWEFADPHASDAQVAEASYQTTSVYGFGHPLYYDNVIGTLRGEAEAETDGREGLQLARAADRDATCRRATAAAWHCRSSTNGMIDDPSDGHRRRRRHARRRHAASGTGCTSARGARIGAGCSFGQNVFVGNDVVIGNNVKIQNNVSVYDTVTLGGRRLLRTEHGVHQRLQPARGGRAQGRIPRTLVRRGATLGANCTHRVRHHGRRARLRRRRRGGAERDVPTIALVVGVPARQIGWMSRVGERLDLPLHGNGSARCEESGATYLLREGVCAMAGQA